MTDIERIKKEVREAQSPYFEEDDFQYYLDKNNGNVRCLSLSLKILQYLSVVYPHKILQLILSDWHLASNRLIQASSMSRRCQDDKHSV